MLAKILNLKSGFLAIAVALMFAAQGQAQEKKAMDLNGTYWSGKENLKDFGPLAFRFDGEGRVMMTDAAGDLEGRWHQDGSSVTIEFGDCVYRGRIEGNRITGTAQFNAGDRAGEGWEFDLALATPKVVF